MKKEISIQIPEFEMSVTGILNLPKTANCVILLAHGAGAGMRHPFMEQISESLADQGLGTLRFNFIYMEKGNKAPDRPKKAIAAISASLEALKTISQLPILLAGKSFGGRMASHLAALQALEGVVGLVFLGFPLHASGKPGIERTAHLQEVSLPMLFLQGTRDTLAQLPMIESVCDQLANSELQIIDGADHSFKMLKRSGKTQDEVIGELSVLVRKFADNLITT